MIAFHLLGKANAIDSARVMHTPQGVAIHLDGEMPNAIVVHEYEQPVK
ncbi:hypothetical protein Sgleb_32130 [Streptomyces glebosus]|uniref:Uncharacterized protein n=1 Tax=Streptomyces glebosus TaxID=249580 RepID=A0A640SYN4_9ACTN|nr:hypothetical protein [Streptomyces glebosus]GFE15166.1 hypothetical protein Sgleb_32130 [Streptomyces glebosus]GHG72877.1 hypothetical protein GCM10010513_45800 [Streptomyces glebosus]